MINLSKTGLCTVKKSAGVCARGRIYWFHCKGGLGRAGMISARLLVELGTEPEKAIRMVRRARSGAIETYTQLALVKQTTAINEDP